MSSAIRAVLSPATSPIARISRAMAISCRASPPADASGLPTGDGGGSSDGGVGQPPADASGLPTGDGGGSGDGGVGNCGAVGRADNGGADNGGADGCGVDRCGAGDCDWADGGEASGLASFPGGVASSGKPR